MRYVDIRVQTIKNRDEFFERLQHNLRGKKDKRVTNENGYITDGGHLIKGFKSKYYMDKLSLYKKLYDAYIEEHKQAYKNYHTKRTRTFAEGILYFSNGINEDFSKNNKEFFVRVKKLMKEFEKDNSTEVLNFQIHPDEAGNVHVHFMFKNYNKNTGKSLNFTRNANNGSYLQDLAHKHFNDFGKGYTRGQKKSKPSKYLPIEDYKNLKEAQKQLSQLKTKNKEIQEQNQELQNQNKEIQEQNQKLKAENTEIQEQNQKLKTEIQEIKNQYEQISEEFYKIINDFEELLLQPTERKKVEKLKTLFGRYSKNENAERMLSTLNKAKKTLNKFKKNK